MKLHELLNAVYDAGMTEGPYEVWYANMKWARDNHFAENPDVDLNDLKKSHTFIGAVSMCDPEMLFEMLNWPFAREDKLPLVNEFFNDLFKNKFVTHSSMSVGDMLVKGDFAKYCAAMGWKTIKRGN